MKFSLEKINKILLLITIVSLVWRSNSFAASHIPNPFEMLICIVSILGALDLIINKKIKEFWYSVPKKIWIALFAFLGSIFLGWGIAVFIKEIPPNFNNILELGGFMMGIVMFLLIIFYTQDDKKYIKQCLYALLVPVLYSIFVLLPAAALNMNLARDGTFLGFTENPNIISKTFLIPTIFFAVSALFESRNKWLKAGYITLSSTSAALLYWSNSRGAVLGLFLGITLSGIIFFFRNFNWKKMLYGALIILTVLFVGFVITPSGGKKQILNRILNPKDLNSGYVALEDKSVTDILHKAVLVAPKSNPATNILPANNTNASILDTRLAIWPVYLKTIVMNPFGFGPNTHMDVAKNEQHYNIGPHNTYIEILLWGGIIGLLSFLYIIRSAFKVLKVKLRFEFTPTSVALTGILLAFSVAFIFNDSLQCYWFWIILALSLSYESNSHNNPSSV